jgi:serine/threonine-protein kinase
MLASGVTIGTYRVLGKIGEGGMGTVYLGEHTLLGRRAAIKVLLPLLSANEDIVRRFFNEARAVTRIADPGIVQIFDFGHHTDGSAFIVMELLDGEAMDKRIARIGRFGMLECLRLMRLVCSSLGVAHSRGIVHRDLKPENIFIVADPAVPGGERAKILDFGIAKLADDPGKAKTRTGLLMGTPMYMSPEQCRGASDVDHRSDIYAMACVMFNMLTGRPPFDGEPGELIAAHLREPPPLAAAQLPGLPDIIDQILQRCLLKSPAERFQSMAELVQAIGFAEQTLFPSNVEPRSPAWSGPFALMLQSLTVPAGSGPARAKRSATTTLNNASGQLQHTSAGRARRWRIAVAISTVALGGIVALVAARAHVNVSASVAPSEATSEKEAAEMHAPAGPAAIDATPSIAPPPAPAADPSHINMGVVVDAGVAEVPEIDASVDASKPSRHVSKPGRRRPPEGGGHGSQTGSAALPTLPPGRGD